MANNLVRDRVCTTGSCLLSLLVPSEVRRTFCFFWAAKPMAYIVVDGSTCCALFFQIFARSLLSLALWIPFSEEHPLCVFCAHWFRLNKQSHAIINKRVGRPFHSRVTNGTYHRLGFQEASLEVLFISVVVVPSFPMQQMRHH
jgi:hypothetical protein